MATTATILKIDFEPLGDLSWNLIVATEWQQSGPVSK